MAGGRSNRTCVSCLSRSEISRQKTKRGTCRAFRLAGQSPLPSVSIRVKASIRAVPAHRFVLCRPADIILHIRLRLAGSGLTDRILGASRLGPFPAVLERLRRRSVALADIDTVASISRAYLRTDVTTQALLQSCALQALACLVALVRDVPCALRIPDLYAMGVRHEQSAYQPDYARADQ
jgi:hypothetical protein